jgi:hypothetical protein
MSAYGFSIRPAAAPPLWRQGCLQLSRAFAQLFLCSHWPCFCVPRAGFRAVRGSSPSSSTACCENSISVLGEGGARWPPAWRIAQVFALPRLLDSAPTVGFLFAQKAQVAQRIAARAGGQWAWPHYVIRSRRSCPSAGSLAKVRRRSRTHRFILHPSMWPWSISRSVVAVASGSPADSCRFQPLV